MTRPYEKWPDIWQFFIALHQDWLDNHEDEESAMADCIEGWSDVDIRNAISQWHEAFDGASDEQIEDVVGDFNPSYDPTVKFGGYRQWAEWVREHLEAELARRS